VPKKSETVITLPKADFVQITKIAGLFARESGGSVTITADVEKKSISIHSIASQLGENTSEATADVTADGQITLNSRYLIEALGVIEGESAEFSFSGKLSPCVLKSTDKNTNYYHIIMPLKS
jgi:DNA polymerase-3 subunit beta